MPLEPRESSRSSTLGLSTRSISKRRSSIVVVDRDVLLRAIEVYETDRLDVTEAYLMASAESTGVGKIASFDGSIDRVPSVERIEPGLS
jgi:predicted nucleic acid-binding protein